LTSNTYYDENQNQYVAQIFSQPINYHNGTDFRPIDTTVIELNKEGYKFGVESGVYQVYLKKILKFLLYGLKGFSDDFRERAAKYNIKLIENEDFSEIDKGIFHK